MIKLAYCPCGCGFRARSPLPPRAAKLKSKRLQDARREQIRAQVSQAIRNHVLLHGPAGGNA